MSTYDPVATHFTKFRDGDKLIDMLDPFIDEIDSPQMPVECHRYVALDGSFHDFALTPMEVFIVTAELEGVIVALRDLLTSKEG